MLRVLPSLRCATGPAYHVVSEISPLLYETLPEAALDAVVRATKPRKSSPDKTFTSQSGKGPNMHPTELQIRN